MKAEKMEEKGQDLLATVTVESKREKLFKSCKISG